MNQEKINMDKIAEITEKARQEKISCLPVKKIDCLNLGYVELIDWLGNNHDIAESARVSYQEGTKKTSNDKNLISRLMRKHHSTPLEQNVLKFQIKAPIFVIIHILKHRTAQFSTINSESGRYSVLKDEFYLPELKRLQKQSSINKQGSGEIIDSDLGLEILACMSEDTMNFNETYQTYLNADISKELARINLPLSTYMSFIWKIDLHNLFNFLKLRMDHHAQYETRVYADAIYDLVKQVYPISISYFEEHILNAYTFSKTELDIIRNIVKHYQSFVIPSIKDIAEKEGLKSTRLNDFLSALGLN